MADADVVASGRGAQVIKVVMPTYIMAPTEDERCAIDRTVAQHNAPMFSFCI